MPCAIPLTKGEVAVVDDSDYARVNQHKWMYDKGYAYRKVYWRASNGKLMQRNVSMQSFILGVEHGVLVDHINRDPLDNQRDNLRLATKAQNNANSGPRGNAQYKGITYHKGDHRWIAQITTGKRRRHLGSFRTPEAAARAYDQAAYALWGEFAYLNFPQELTTP